MNERIVVVTSENVDFLFDQEETEYIILYHDTPVFHSLDFQTATTYWLGFVTAVKLNKESEG